MLHRKPGQFSIKFTRPGQMKSIMRDETHLDLQEIQASSYLSEKVPLVHHVVSIDHA